MKKKTRYVIAAIIFGAGFFLSIIALVNIATVWTHSRIRPLPGPPPEFPPQAPPPPRDRDNGTLGLVVLLVPAFSALITAIGTISTVALAWKAARRDKRE